MPVELKISWEGNAPGVPEHRLSIGAFVPALAELLRAYRRIASNMMRAAAPTERGRLKELANRLDIEIESVAGTNPLQLTSACTFTPPPDVHPSLFQTWDIAERAAKELLDSIEDESNGRPRNSAVRSYLQKLPLDLSQQTYELRENGNVLHAPVVIQNLNLITPSLSGLPYLLEFEGSIIGVGFEPGTNQVKVKTDDDVFSFSASAELVDAALRLRGSIVKGLAVRQKDSRLLRLTAVGDSPFSYTDQVRKTYIFERWNDLLTKLAQ